MSPLQPPWRATVAAAPSRGNRPRRASADEFARQRLDLARVEQPPHAVAHPADLEPGQMQPVPGKANHFTFSGKLWLWLLNSGAYMHWICAMPVWYSPRSWTRVEYSNT